MEYPEIRFLVFAKAPLENQVKTRLIPDIGAQNATQLHRLMTLQTVSLVANSGLCPVQLWCSPDSQQEFFQQIKHQYSVELFDQQGQNLGARMQYAARHTLQSAKSVIIIGSDCLQLSKAHLNSAIVALTKNDNDVVITPAHDGGYVLIGLNRIDTDLFENISWGSSQVMEQTRNALRKLQWSWHEPEPLQDLDTKTDLLDIVVHQSRYQLSPELDNFIHSLSL